MPIDAGQEPEVLEAEGPAPAPVVSAWSPFGDRVEKDKEAAPTWGDYGTTLKVGAKDVKGMYYAAGRYLSEKMGSADDAKYFEAGSKLNKMDTEEATAELSEGARSRLHATLTSEDFWKHPVSATALKAARMTPTFAAAVIPATLMPGVAVATIGGGTIGGAMSASQLVDEIYDRVDNETDQKLQQDIPYYAGLRTRMDEAEARKQYTDTIRGNKPLMMFVLGSVTNAIGPAGQVTRAIKGGSASVTGAGRGVVARTGIGAAEGAATEGLEEGASNLGVQSAAIQGGLQTGIDNKKLIDAALEGAWMGAIPGGAASAVSGGQRAAKVPAAQPKVEAVTEIGPNAEEALAINGPAPAPAPVEAAPAAPAEVAQASAAIAEPQTIEAFAAGVKEKLDAGGVPTQVTKVMRSYLVDLGYSRDEIKTMTPPEAADTIANMRQKAGTEEILAPEEPAGALAEVPVGNDTGSKVAPEVIAASERIAEPVPVVAPAPVKRTGRVLEAVDEAGVSARAKAKAASEELAAKRAVQEAKSDKRVAKANQTPEEASRYKGHKNAAFHAAREANMVTASTLSTSVTSARCLWM